METLSRHQCFVYEGPPSKHLGTLASIIKKKLQDNFRCLYLNSPEMVSAMHSSLQFQQVKVADETAKTRLLMSTGTALTEDGHFNIDVMIARLEDAVLQALRDGFKGLFVTGDMTWELGVHKENFAKLIDYEWRLEKLFHKQPALCGICQYHQDTLSPEMMRAGLLSHQSLFINDTLSRINSFYSESVPEAKQSIIKNAQELDEAVGRLFKSQDGAGSF